MNIEMLGEAGRGRLADFLPFGEKCRFQAQTVSKHTG